MSWYVFLCTGNQQRRTEANLRNQVFDILSPCTTIESIVRRKRVIGEEAMFSGYIFIRLVLEHSDWRALNNIFGARKIISFNGCPCNVFGDMINTALQQFGAHEKPAVMFKANYKVQVIEGCFKNIEAIIKSVASNESVAVLLNILKSFRTIFVLCINWQKLYGKIGNRALCLRCCNVCMGRSVAYLSLGRPMLLLNT